LQGEAGGLVRVECSLAGAEDVGADQVDLQEDAEDDCRGEAANRRRFGRTGGRDSNLAGAVARCRSAP